MGSEVTVLLHALRNGDRSALDRLQPLVYDELRAVAARQLRGERRDHTLQPTELVHEAYLRLLDRHSPDWQSRAHFLGVAAQTIRRILVEHARARSREKRGGGLLRVTLSESMRTDEPDLDLLALDDALEKLGREDRADLEIVVLRYFGGLSVKEIAEVRGISERTVHRRWEFAKAWLYRALHGDAAS